MPRNIQKLTGRRAESVRNRSVQVGPPARYPLLVWFVLAVFLLSCGPAATSPDTADRAGQEGADAVREVIRNWAAALNRRPMEVAQSYTADALLLWPEAASIAGADAIQAHLAERLAGLNSFTYRSEERMIDARLAYERGRFVAAVEGREPLVGSILHVLVAQSDGSWRIFREVWVPEPVAAP